MNQPESLAAVGPFASITVPELANQIRRGETSALEITEQALAAAHKYGTRLNCFTTVDEDGARQAAQRADEELASGLDRGPLHGVPVGIKDVIATSGLRTTMGSRHFADHVPSADADVVTAMRRAGSVIIGKTQTHEFAYGPTSDRAAQGPARNPHDTTLMTGGSSGGSAAAIAAGLVPIALGTDTGGSLRIPAALCGTVGLRPTQGSLSSQGIFPLSPTMDVAGPLATNVTDTAIAWWALSATPDYQGDSRPTWKENTLRDLRTTDVRIAQVSCELTRKATPALAETVKIAAETLEASVFCVSALDVPEIDECAFPYQMIQSAEAFAIHCDRVEKSPELHDPEVLERLLAAAEVKGWEYVRALATRRRLLSAMLRRLAAVDVLLMPSVPIAAPAIGERILQGQAGWTNPRGALLAMTLPWSVLGFPAISVPVQKAGHRMPSSVQLISKPGQEWQLLSTALVLEESLTGRR